MQRQIGAPAEKRGDDIYAAAMLLPHPPHRFLAEERYQGRIILLSSKLM